MTIVLPIPHSERSTSEGFAQAGSLNQSGPSIPIWPRIVLTGPCRVEEVDEAERRGDRRGQRGQVEDRAEEADARLARVSITAMPKANSTCSGTPTAMIQSVF